MRPQGGPVAQSVGGDEEENRVFLLVVGLGSQVIFVNIIVINFMIIFFLIFVIIIHFSVPSYQLFTSGVSGNSLLPYKFVGNSHEFIRQTGIPAHP